MIIEVRGVNFRNKGAELMLHAVLQNARAASGKPAFVLHKRVGTSEQRNSLGIHGKVLWRERGRLRAVDTAYNLLVGIAPRFARRRSGFMSVSDIGALLDASGFAFGDPWGAQTSEIAARYFRTLKDRGAKIILLPQQLGPFEDRATREQFGRILDVADLVFARDQVSLDLADAVRPGTPNLRQAPDFTVGVRGYVPQYFHPSGPHVCIVPNVKMTTHADVAKAAWYRAFLVGCARYLMERGVEFSVLIHEDKGGDYRVALQLQADVGAELRVIHESNPLALKGILSRCHVTIGSRYHGLVSALASGVPSLGTGWSHKYEMLFADFGCSDYLVDPTHSDDAIIGKLANLIDSTERAEVVGRLEAGRERYLRQTCEMWALVEKVLG